MEFGPLRQHILQLAISGQLVEQLDSEPEVKQVGPATRPDEVPFERPSKWKWVPLGSLVNLINGDRGPNYPAKSKLSSNDTGLPFVSAGDLEGNEISSKSLLYLSQEQCQLLRSGHIQAGDFLLCIRGSLGKFAIAKESGGAIASSLVILRSKSVDLLNTKYLSCFLQSGLFKSDIEQTRNGSCQPNLSAKLLANFLVPLPPLEEQRRIVAVVDELMGRLDQMEAAYSEFAGPMTEHFRNLMLNKAIRGELVPQLDSEPEVEQLGPAPQPDEVPFELPSKWKWVNFESVLDLISGRDLTLDQIHSDDGSSLTPYLTGASQIENGVVIVNRWTDAPVVISDKDDILLTCKGTVGKLAINTVGSMHIARQIMAIRCTSRLEPKFVLLFLQTYVSKLKVSAKGLIPGITRKDVLSLWVPLPPLGEQRRIVAELEEVFAGVEKLGSLMEYA